MTSTNTPKKQQVSININTLRICRICLQTGKLQPFKESSLYRTFISILYSDKTKSNYEEDMPQNICKGCISELENVTSFIAKIKNNTKTLKQIYQTFWNMTVDGQSSIASQDLQAKQEVSPNGEVCPSEEHIILEVETDEDTPSIENILKDDSNEVPEVKLHTCIICGKGFTFQSSWKYHMSTHSEVKFWECSLCEWAGLDENCLEEHVKGVHENEYEKNCDYTESEEKFLCNICGQAFLQKNLLAEHIDIHAEEKYSSCKLCGLKFILESTLNKHMEVHLQTEKFYCNLCDKNFTKKFFLDTHIAIYHGPKQKPPNLVKRPYSPCSRCGKRFQSEKSLQKHEEICEEEFSEDMYLCVHCGKKFSFKTNLNRHILIVHASQKRFSCKICGERFTVKNSLKYHMYIHSDSKPYQCIVCSRGFRQPSALVRHKSTVHNKEKKAQCNICYKWLKSRDTLNSHMTRHSKQSPF